MAELSELALGYRLGYALGWDHGHDQGVADEGAAWSSALTGVTDSWRQPRQAELVAAREPDHQPCPSRCRSCSRCIHSLAWYANGRQPFTGGPVPAW